MSESNKSSISTFLSIDEANSKLNKTKVMFKSNSMKILENRLDCLNSTNFKTIEKQSSSKNIYLNPFKLQKEYNQKIEKLQNRIKIISQKDKQISKKAQILENKSLKERQIRVQRKNEKDKLFELQLLKHNEQKKLKQEIQNKKQQRELSISSKHRQSTEKKQINYKIVKKDSKIILSLTNEIKEHYHNINNYKSFKVKESERLIKENKIKDENLKNKQKVKSKVKIISETNKTKIEFDMTIKKLEDKEKEKMNQLNKHINKVINITCKVDKILEIDNYCK